MEYGFVAAGVSMSFSKIILPHPDYHWSGKRRFLTSRILKSIDILTFSLQGQGRRKRIRLKKLKNKKKNP
jgi:hypothetical protein